MSKKIIIFDFDGTIADTLAIGIEMYNKAAPFLNCKVLNEEDVEDLRCQRPQEFLKKYGVTKFKLPFLLFFARKRLCRRISQIRPVAGVDEMLKKISVDSRFELGILTSNSEKNVRCFLKNNNLDDVFSFIYSDKSVFGKEGVMNKMLKDRGFLRSQVIYVGDETRDVEAAKRAKIPIIAVGWGFNSLEVLRELSPDYI
ncbi:HAD-IA family hydrolase, partial [Patescibacteria group bacterium]